MKLIKKIVVIMFAFMMVVSMSCNVKADEGTTPTTGETGTITIDKAIDGQTYTIYKLLDLESYDEPNNHYSYRPATEWKNFFETTEAKNFITIDENGYANWVKGADQVAFAQKALAYAKDKTHPITGTSKDKEKGVALTFENLSLGYYLVDSSVGALCSLNTTNPTVTIEEKNDVPTVEKKVSNEQEGTFDKSTFANIGDRVYFSSEITVKDGAENYVLHDKMDSGLTLDVNSIEVKLSDKALVKDTDYQVFTNVTDELENSKCTFHIAFKDEFYNKAKLNDKVTVTYFAVLNQNAFVGQDHDHDGNKNRTWLGYGDSKITVESKVNVFTLKLPVYKYTIKDSKKTGLKNAKFMLYNSKNAIINLVKPNETEEVYRKALVTEASTIQEITTTDTGKFEIQGLAPGTYYLKETEAPKGYNKLAQKITIIIDNNNLLTVNGKNTIDNGVITEVGVENKSGTVLPSTGGAGTTMIYLIGGALVLGSGVVLATKRRVKNK